MRKIFAIAALGLALVAFGNAPAMAQEAERSQAISSCTIPPVSSDACNAAIAAFLGVVATLPPGQADDALADLVNVLAASSSPEARDAISIAIVTIAAEISDPVRAEAAVQVSTEVAAGQPVTTTVPVQGSAN